MASGPYVYDKAKYHIESVTDLGLDEDQAYVHTAFYFRWLLEQRLYGSLMEETDEFLMAFHQGNASALDVYKAWDGCLVDDMLTDAGNAFSRHYFDFETGFYLKDYEILADGLPSFFHVQLSEENYQKLKPMIDQAYSAWKFRN
ncbi:DUF7832 domain-containing protein [Rhizobium sp.]